MRPSASTSYQIARSPHPQLAQNAGQDGAVIIETVRRQAKEQKNKNIGYNVLTGEYGDMIKAASLTRSSRARRASKTRPPSRR